MIGWVRLHRKLAHHPIWTREKFTRGQAWVDLILMASHVDHAVFQGNKLMTVKRGQTFTSQVTLAKRWRWNRETVRAFLRSLESANMIAIETSRATDTGYTLITLLNYDLYQGDSSDAKALPSAIDSAIETSIEPPSNRHRAATIKNGKNDKNGVEDLSLRKGVQQTKPDSLNGFVSQAVQYLNDKAGMSYRLTTKSTVRHLTARARDGFTIEDVKLVIDSKVEEWFDDAKMYSFLRPETLFGPKFESYLQKARLDLQEEKP